MNNLSHKFDTNYILNQPNRHEISPANTTSNSIVEKLFSYKIGSHLFRRIYVRNVYFAGLQTAIVILVSKSEH